MPDQNPPPTAVAWTCKAGTHSPVIVEAATVTGPMGHRVQVSGDFADGHKALALDMPVATAEQLLEQLTDALARIPKRARRRQAAATPALKAA